LGRGPNPTPEHILALVYKECVFLYTLRLSCIENTIFYT